MTQQQWNAYAMAKTSNEMLDRDAAAEQEVQELMAAEAAQQAKRDRLAAIAEEKRKRLGQPKTTPTIDNSVTASLTGDHENPVYHELEDGTLLQMDNKIIHDYTPEDVQALEGYMASQRQVLQRPDGSMYFSGDNQDYTGPTGKNYQFGTADGITKIGKSLGIVDGQNIPAEARYVPGMGNKIAPSVSSSYGWKPGAKGVDVGDKQMGINYTKADSSLLEAVKHWAYKDSRVNMRAPGETQFSPEVVVDYGSGKSEYYKPGFAGDTSANTMTGEQALARGKEIYDDLMNQEGLAQKLHADDVYIPKKLQTVKGYMGNIVDATQYGIGRFLANTADTIVDAGLRAVKEIDKMDGSTEAEANSAIAKLADSTMFADMIDKDGNFTGLDKYKLEKEYGYDSSIVQNAAKDLRVAYQHGDLGDKIIATAKAIKAGPEVFMTSIGDMIGYMAGPVGWATIAANANNEILEERAKIKGTTDLSAEDYGLAATFAVPYAMVNMISKGNVGITELGKVLPTLLKSGDDIAIKAFGKVVYNAGKEVVIKSTGEGLEEVTQEILLDLGKKLMTVEQDTLISDKTGEKLFESFGLGMGAGVVGTVGKGAIKGVGGAGMDYAKDHLGDQDIYRRKHHHEYIANNLPKSLNKETREKIIKAEANLRNSTINTIHDMEEAYIEVLKDADLEHMFDTPYTGSNVTDDDDEDKGFKPDATWKPFREGNREKAAQLSNEFYKSVKNPKSQEMYSELVMEDAIKYMVDANAYMNSWYRAEGYGLGRILEDVIEKMASINDLDSAKSRDVLTAGMIEKMYGTARKSDADIDTINDRMNTIINDMTDDVKPAAVKAYMNIVDRSTRNNLQGYFQRLENSMTVSGSTDGVVMSKEEYEGTKRALEVIRLGSGPEVQKEIDTREEILEEVYTTGNTPTEVQKQIKETGFLYEGVYKKGLEQHKTDIIADAVADTKTGAMGELESFAASRGAKKYRTHQVVGKGADAVPYEMNPYQIISFLNAEISDTEAMLETVVATIKELQEIGGKDKYSSTVDKLGKVGNDLVQTIQESESIKKAIKAVTNDGTIAHGLDKASVIAEILGVDTDTYVSELAARQKVRESKGITEDFKKYTEAGVGTDNIKEEEGTTNDDTTTETESTESKQPDTTEGEGSTSTSEDGPTEEQGQEQQEEEVVEQEDTTATKEPEVEDIDPVATEPEVEQEDTIEEPEVAVEAEPTKEVEDEVMATIEANDIELDNILAELDMVIKELEIENKELSVKYKAKMKDLQVTKKNIKRLQGIINASKDKDTKEDTEIAKTARKAKDQAYVTKGRVEAEMKEVGDEQKDVQREISRAKADKAGVKSEKKYRKLKAEHGDNVQVDMRKSLLLGGTAGVFTFSKTPIASILDSQDGKAVTVEESLMAFKLQLEGNTDEAVVKRASKIKALLPKSITDRMQEEGTGGMKYMLQEVITYLSERQKHMNNRLANQAALPDIAKNHKSKKATIKISKNKNGITIVEGFDHNGNKADVNILSLLAKSTSTTTSSTVDGVTIIDSTAGGTTLDDNVQQAIVLRSITMAAELHTANSITGSLREKYIEKAYGVSAGTDAYYAAESAFSSGLIPESVYVENAGKDVLRELGIGITDTLDTNTIHALEAALGTLVIDLTKQFRWYEKKNEKTGKIELKERGVKMKRNPKTGKMEPTPSTFVESKMDTVGMGAMVFNDATGEYEQSVPGTTYSNQPRKMVQVQALLSGRGLTYAVAKLVNAVKSTFEYLSGEGEPEVMMERPSPHVLGEKIKRSGQAVSQAQVDYLNMQEAKEHTFTPEFIETAEKMKEKYGKEWVEKMEELLLESMDDIRDMQINDAEKALANRNGQKIQVQRMLATYDMTEGKPFYLKWEAISNDRSQIKGAALNMQGSTISRFFVSTNSEVGTVSGESTESDINTLNIGLAQAFDKNLDESIDKTTDDKALADLRENVVDVTTVDGKLGVEVKDAIKPLYEAYKTFLETGDVEAFTKTLKKYKTKERGHVIQALNTIKQIEDKKGEEVTHSLALEIDAITSGMILTLLEIASDEAMKLAEKGGVYMEGSKHKSHGEYMKDNPDIYMTPIKGMFTGIKKFLNEGRYGFTREGDEKFSEADKVTQDIIIDMVMDKFLGDKWAKLRKGEGTLGQEEQKKLRNSMKPFVMVYIYGASVNNIINKLGVELGGKAITDLTGSKDMKDVSIDSIRDDGNAAMVRYRGGESLDTIKSSMENKNILPVYMMLFQDTATELMDKNVELDINDILTRQERKMKKMKFQRVSDKGGIETIKEGEDGYGQMKYLTSKGSVLEDGEYVIKQVMGEPVRKSFGKEFGEIERFRKTNKSLQAIRYMVFLKRYRDKTKKYMNEKGQTVISKAQQQKIYMELINEHAFHGTKGATGSIQEFLKNMSNEGVKTTLMGGNEIGNGTKMTDVYTKQKRPEMNVGALGVIDTHSKDSAVMVMNHISNATNIYDALIMIAELSNLEAASRDMNEGVANVAKGHSLLSAGVQDLNQFVEKSGVTLSEVVESLTAEDMKMIVGDFDRFVDRKPGGAFIDANSMIESIDTIAADRKRNLSGKIHFNHMYVSEEAEGVVVEGGDIMAEVLSEDTKKQVQAFSEVLNEQLKAIEAVAEQDAKAGTKKLDDIISQEKDQQKELYVVMTQLESTDKDQLTEAQQKKLDQIVANIKDC